MRQLLVLAALASACAPHAAVHTTIPAQYTCGDITVAAPFDGTRLGWHDDAGDHYVAWPQTPVDVEAVEIVVPNDPRQDAVRRVYDASKGHSTADWRLIRRQVCPAKGGYSDVLARYLRGESLDDLAHELALGDRDHARDVVHQAMLTLQKRYYHDR